MALRSSKLPGPCVRWDWLCHLSAAEAVTQYCGFPSRNDDGFRDFAWQKSASLHSHESRVCHWAGRDTAIRPLCHNRTIGWHWSRSPLDVQEVSFIITPRPPPPPPPPHPAKNKQTEWLAASASHHHHSSKCKSWCHLTHRSPYTTDTTLLIFIILLESSSLLVNSTQCYVLRWHVSPQFSISWAL